MPVLTFSKSQLGPILEVSVWPGTEAANQLRHAGKDVPQPSQLMMLVDSGSEGSVIDESLIRPWNTPYVSSAWAATIAGRKPVQQYEVALSIRGQPGQPAWNIPSLLVSARQSPFTGMPYLGLIGRDILDRAVFVFNGPAHHCTLAY